MPAVNASVLLLTRSPVPAMTIDYMTQNHWPDASHLSSAAVLVIDSDLFTDLKKDLAGLLKQRPDVQWIYCTDKKNKAETVADIVNEYRPFRLCLNPDGSLLQEYIIQALEKSQWVKQKLDLEKTVKEQQHNLKALYQDLEDRILKRQKYLEDARKKAYIANSRWDTVRLASEAIHQAVSVGEMEKLLTEALSAPLQLSVTKIIFSPQDQMFSQQVTDSGNYSVLQTALRKELSTEQNGSVFFLRQKGHPYGKDEIEFLHKITEAISLSLSRILKLEQMEALLEQWQATFDAVADPVCMINSNYEIVQSNKALLKKAEVSSDQVLQAKCYAVLFGRSQPCPGCDRGKNFRLEQSRGQQTFDVYSQEIFIDPLKERLFVHQYHDVTEQLKIERKILESAKLAELGSIGSSIAHELNNPLGGILSFVQLIKMNMKSDHPIYEDVLEMERGVLRCRDIIENLLGFTRKANEEEKRTIDLAEVIERAIKIIELHTRSRGIELKLHIPKNMALIDGSINILVQAFQNLFQKSLEAIESKMSLQKGFHGVIEVRLNQDQERYVITLLDNGLGSEAATGLAIPVATQIIHDHSGDIIIDSNTGPFRMAKISFPRLVLKSKSPE